MPLPRVPMKWPDSRLLAAMTLLSSMLPASNLAAQLAPTQADLELEEVLVLGEQPGPAMWKVSRDGHTLWVMGTMTPRPSSMTWRSTAAEGVIQRSGEILGSTSTRVTLGVGLFGAMKLIPAALKARDNPDGSTLHDVLPVEVRTRYSAMHRRFFGKDMDQKEKRRPLFAADELYREAMKKSGLTTDSLVWPKVEKLAKRYKVGIRERQIPVALEDPKGIIGDLALIKREQEVACLVGTMDYIEQELPNIKQRARAWAVGDVAALRSLPPAVDRMSCQQALTDALQPRLETQINETRETIEEDREGIVSWMLLAHETSFTTMDIQELLAKDGAVARWRAAGYTVEEPQ